MIILAIFSFIFLIIALQMAEGMSAKKSAEYVEKSSDDATFVSKSKRDAMLLSAKDGQTFSRSVKVFTNPVFLVCAAVFIVIAATGVKLL